MGCEQIDPAEDDRREKITETEREGVDFSADQLLAMDDLPSVSVIVPEWKNARVVVLSTTAADRDAWESFLVAHQGKDGKLNSDRFRATLVAMTAADVTGKQLFRMEDVDKLAKKSESALARICNASIKLNKLSNDDIEELVKNPGGGLSDGPPSGSAGNKESGTPTTSTT